MGNSEFEKKVGAVKNGSSPNQLPPKAAKHPPTFTLSDASTCWQIEKHEKRREVLSSALYNFPLWRPTLTAKVFRPSLVIELSWFIKCQHYNCVHTLSFYAFLCKQVRISYCHTLLLAQGCNSKYGQFLLLDSGPLVTRMNHAIILPKTGWTYFKL